MTSVREKDRTALHGLHEDEMAARPGWTRSRPVTSATKPCVDVSSAGVGYGEALSFLEQHPQAWHVLRKALGPKEAWRLAQVSRNKAMTRLRVEHRWTLQAIGDLLGLGRERVRQLTPPMIGKERRPSCSTTTTTADRRTRRL
jgi:hypothetical protein